MEINKSLTTIELLKILNSNQNNKEIKNKVLPSDIIEDNLVDNIKNLKLKQTNSLIHNKKYEKIDK